MLVLRFQKRSSFLITLPTLHTMFLVFDGIFFFRTGVKQNAYVIFACMALFRVHKCILAWFNFFFSFQLE